MIYISTTLHEQVITNLLRERDITHEIARQESMYGGAYGLMLIHVGPSLCREAQSSHWG